jgi:hypothetical protein
MHVHTHDDQTAAIFCARHTQLPCLLALGTTQGAFPHVHVKSKCCVLVCEIEDIPGRYSVKLFREDIPGSYSVKLFREDIPCVCVCKALLTVWSWHPVCAHACASLCMISSVSPAKMLLPFLNHSFGIHVSTYLPKRKIVVPVPVWSGVPSSAVVFKHTILSCPCSCLVWCAVFCRRIQAHNIVMPMFRVFTNSAR